MRQSQPPGSIRRQIVVVAEGLLDCVIGGPGAFIMTIKDREKFQEAIRTKLVCEIAGLTLESGIVPAAEKEPRVPCLIGEKNRSSAGGALVRPLQSGRAYH